MSVKKLLLTVFLSAFVVACFAQENDKRKSAKKDAKRQKVSEMIKQAEEGVLVYRKQSIFGIQARSNGYGIFYELGRMKTNLKTSTYRIDFTEIKNQKEEKLSANDPGSLFFGNPFIYGKINNFYQLTLGVGQQRILGQKGNKNGVSVSAVANGGLAIGLLRPYYVEIRDPMGGPNKTIKYSEDDRDLFLGPTIVGGGGLGKGWGEMKIKPGAFAKTALRFDYGRFNEIVSGIEVGISAEFYGSKITIMADQKDKQLFFQGYIAILFGKRK
ncbi:hypothetical protein CAP36_00775 [Chitinophagaceae bacterium IBVUCB2]|nr:hypothetical protein CAP36_00775 [Chitinophagaceae bacterium IBVUCB2]